MSEDAFSDVEAELNEATERARKLVQTTEPRLFTVRPNLASWSAAECVAHLSISTEQFLAPLTEAVNRARQSGLTASGSPRMDLLGAILRWFLEPPVRTKVKTTAPFVPRSVRAKAEALGEFVSLQGKLLDIIRGTRDLDLRRIKIRSPFDRRLRFNAYSAFRIIVAHQRRHLWQAEQAVDALRRMRAA